MGRPGLPLHRKSRRLARTLDDVQRGFGMTLARGSLELLWDGCYEAGDDFLGDAVDVEARAGWGGTEGLLCAALEEAGGPGHAGFIEQGGSAWWPEGVAGTFRVHDLFDHAPRYVKRRVQLEEQRRTDGKSISALRSAAGRKGAEVTNLKRSASGRQMDGSLPPNDRQGGGIQPAKVVPPAPAPAPAPTTGAPPARLAEEDIRPPKQLLIVDATIGLPPMKPPTEPSPYQLAADAWFTTWEAAGRGKHPPLTQAEGATLKRLVREHGVTDLIERFHRAMADSWFGEKGDLLTFSRKRNSFAPRGRSPGAHLTTLNGLEEIG